MKYLGEVLTEELVIEAAAEASQGLQDTGQARGWSEEKMLDRMRGMYYLICALIPHADGSIGMRVRARQEARLRVQGRMIEATD